MVSNALSTFMASDKIPTLPDIAVRVIECTQKEDGGAHELAEIIRFDPAIVGRILRFANSAVFGGGRSVESIEEAIARIGSMMVRTIVLGFSLPKFERGDIRVRQGFRQVWRECLLQAVAAESLAHRVPGADAGTWFLAGLLQDVGRLAMLCYDADRYVDQVQDLSERSDVCQKEIGVFGFDHVEVTTSLCASWGLETELIAAIAEHHVDLEIAGLRAEEHSAPTLADGMRAAAAIADYLEGITSHLACSRQCVDQQLIRRFYLRPDEVFSTLADIDLKTTQTAAAFSVDIGNPPNAEELLEHAQSALVDIAVSAQIEAVQAGGAAEVPRNRLSKLMPFRKPATQSVPDPAGGDFRGVDGLLTESFLRAALPGLIRSADQAEVALNFIVLSCPVPALEEDTDGPVALLTVNAIAADLQMLVRPEDHVVSLPENRFVVVVRDLPDSVVTEIAVHLIQDVASGSLAQRILRRCPQTVPSPLVLQELREVTEEWTMKLVRRLPGNRTTSSSRELLEELQSSESMLGGDNYSGESVEWKNGKRSSVAATPAH